MKYILKIKNWRFIHRIVSYKKKNKKNILKFRVINLFISYLKLFSRIEIESYNISGLIIHIEQQTYT